MPELSEQELSALRALIRAYTSVDLSPCKRAMVSGRLSGRLRALNLSSYREYLERLHDPAERERAIDLLTTHETYFFREPAHYDRLARAVAARRPGGTFRAWSAAASTGEEAYGMAMVITQVMGAHLWEVLGTDVSAGVLTTARRGRYPDSRAAHLPLELKRLYCLRGTGAAAGTLMVDRLLRDRVTFRQLNLDADLPGDLGAFDVIFLRNVLIYFSLDTRRRVIARVAAQLAPGGLLMIGHTETLADVPHRLIGEAPSIYRAPGGVS